MMYKDLVLFCKRILSRRYTLERLYDFFNSFPMNRKEKTEQKLQKISTEIESQTTVNLFLILKTLIWATRNKHFIQFIINTSM